MISKQDLVKKAAKEVRTNPELFAAFNFYYKEEFNKEPNCSGCAFSGTFTRWQRELQPKNLINMSNTNNTFKIDTVKYKQKMLYIPFDGRVLTESSDDSLAMVFLTDAKGNVIEARKKFFSVLPEELRNPKKVAKKVEEIEVVAPEVVVEKPKKKPRKVNAKPKAKREKKVDVSDVNFKEVK